MAQYDHSDWNGSTGGTLGMQRFLMKLFRFIPVSFAYAVMAFVIPFYMVFDRRGYKASYRFFRKRIGRSAVHSFLSVYANEFRLGQVVLDRFAFYAGKKYDFILDGQEHFDRLAVSQQGFIQLSSHVGNSELAGYSFKSIHKPVRVLAYSGESSIVMQQRAEMFSRTNMTLIPVAEDMSHIFALNAALLAGDIVTMPGDRLFGSSKSISCKFFGDSAKFPAGPFRLASQRDVPMLATFVMKEGVRRYRVYVRSLEGEDRAQEYAGLLEETVRKYPTQWFNFYDFWK